MYIFQAIRRKPVPSWLGPGSVVQRPKSFALLQVRQQIHSEATPLCYKANRLDLTEYPWFAGAAEGLGPNICGAVRSIELPWSIEDDFKRWRTAAETGASTWGSRAASTFTRLERIEAGEEACPGPFCDESQIRSVIGQTRKMFGKTELEVICSSLEWDD